jgi:hypothetical protein
MPESLGVFNACTPLPSIVLRPSGRGAVMDTERLAAALIDRTLPKRQWTHEAHLRAGLWHLLNHTEAEALELLRTRIRAYNESTGVANTEVSGYHETVTRFYLRVIGKFLDAADAARPIDELADELIAKYGARDLPLRHYSRERLFSPQARRSWMDPDLQPL